MLKSKPPTVQEWLRGWTLTYIPNDDEAERLAQKLHSYLEASGFTDLRLSDDVREEVETMMGTAQDDDARSPAAVVEEILLERVPLEVARAAAGPVAFRTLNQGRRTLEIDVEDSVPSMLATLIEKRIRPQITDEGIDRLQDMYERLGPEGLRMWLLQAD